MAINEFLPFGLATGSNILPQSAFATLASRTTGFQSGVAQSQECNKVWRQSAFIAAVVAQFISDRTSTDMLDNGDVPGAEASLLAAIQQVAQALINSGGYGKATDITAEAALRLAGDNNEAAIRASADTNEGSTRATADTAEALARSNADTALGGRFAGYVEKGTGVGQLANPVKVGWTGTRLNTTVDATDLGSIAFDSILANTVNTFAIKIGALYIQSFVTPLVNVSAGVFGTSYPITFPQVFPNGVFWMGGSDGGNAGISWSAFSNFTATTATGFVYSPVSATGARGRILAVGF